MRQTPTSLAVRLCLAVAELVWRERRPLTAGEFQLRLRELRNRQSQAGQRSIQVGSWTLDDVG
jgi:hypothetical protein